MPTYRNDTRSAVLVENSAGILVPVAPKETVETVNLITMDGFTLIDEVVDSVIKSSDKTTVIRQVTEAVSDVAFPDDVLGLYLLSVAVDAACTVSIADSDGDTLFSKQFTEVGKQNFTSDVLDFVSGTTYSISAPAVVAFNFVNMVVRELS